jgi:hypothetical protein
MDETVSEALYQHWKHSHEEDTLTQTVFRSITYNFPRSRGRFSFELQQDGTAVFHEIGQTDRSQLAVGIWRLEGDRLLLYSNPVANPDRVLEIISLSPDRLVVSR